MPDGSVRPDESGRYKDPIAQRLTPYPRPANPFSTTSRNSAISRRTCSNCRPNSCSSDLTKRDARNAVNTPSSPTPTTINPTTHVAETAKAALARIDAELAELHAVRDATDLAIAAKDAERAVYANGTTRKTIIDGMREKADKAMAATYGNGNQ